MLLDLIKFPLSGKDERRLSCEAARKHRPQPPEQCTHETVFESSAVFSIRTINTIIFLAVFLFGVSVIVIVYSIDLILGA